MNTLCLLLLLAGGPGEKELTQIDLGGKRITAPMHAVYHNGEYFVLQETGVVRVFDNKREVRTISEQGEEPGQLKNPTWIAAFDGDLYVLQKMGKISVFSTQGEFQGDIQLVDPSGHLALVNGLYVHKGDFLVTFDKHGFIKRFKRHGELASSFKSLKDPYLDHMLNIFDMDVSADGKTAHVVNQFDGTLIQVDLEKEKAVVEHRYAFRGVESIVKGFYKQPDPNSPISFTRAKVFYPLQEKDGKPIVISRLKEEDGTHLTAQFDAAGKPMVGSFHMAGVEIKPTYMKRLGDHYLVIDMAGQLFLTNRLF